jgi:hypothetical protein
LNSAGVGLDLLDEIGPGAGVAVALAPRLVTTILFPLTIRGSNRNTRGLRR